MILVNGSHWGNRFMSSSDKSTSSAVLVILDPIPGCASMSFNRPELGCIYGGFLDCVISPPGYVIGGTWTSGGPGWAVAGDAPWSIGVVVGFAGIGVISWRRNNTI